MYGPYEREQVETWAAEFENSQVYGALPAPAKPYAVSIIAEFLSCACASENVGLADLTEKGVSDALFNSMPSLALPDAVRRLVPEIIRDALAWLETTGRLGEGTHLGRIVMAAAAAYRERLAPRGGERIKPIVRESSKIGRNDPCPCGSGRKFKKCCGGEGGAGTS